MRELAQRLLALEASRTSEADPQVHDALRVFEKLGASLGRFAGPDGFVSLLRRAVKLAQADIPALASVAVKADGAPSGFEQVAADAEDGGTEAAITIVAHLLGLLLGFVGEPITLRLVRDAWPDAASSAQS